MIVLDTNVISETMRPIPDANVIAWLNSQNENTLYLASITVAELLFGVGILPDGTRKTRLKQAIEQTLALFRYRILAFDIDAARKHAAIGIAARATGKPLPVSDSYIGAIAAVHGFTVATRNITDFAGLDVKTINPWQTS